jgi:hypothetical protein
MDGVIANECLSRKTRRKQRSYRKKSKLLELEQRLLERKATDSDYDNKLRVWEAKKHWRDLTERLINNTQYLASSNVASRGHRKTSSLDSPQNLANVRDLVKILSKYDISVA